MCLCTFKQDGSTIIQLVPQLANSFPDMPKLKYAVVELITNIQVVTKIGCSDPDCLTI